MRIIDLSVPIYTGMEVYPGDPEVSLEVVHDYVNKPWLLRRIILGSHTGTHADAFVHMDPHGKTLDEIGLEQFCGPACLVGGDSPLPPKMGLLFREEADISWLQKIIDAGAPFAGFAGDSLSEELQRALLKAGIVTYTNLANLDCLPTRQAFLFVGLPLKLRGGDGSPVRAVAVLDE